LAHSVADIIIVSMALVASAVDRATNHLRVLAEILEEKQFEEIEEHLRLLALETRLDGPRKNWEAQATTAAATAESVEKAASHLLGVRSDQQPQSLALEEREGMGRVLVATQEIARGELLFEEAPLMVIPDCALESGRPQGPLMAELETQGLKVGVALDMDALCVFFSRQTENQLATLWELESHIDHEDYTAGRLADKVAKLAAAKGLLLESDRQADLARFLRIISVNAHTIPRIRGVMLFFWLSMLSHSCAPNATYGTYALTGENLQEREQGSTGEISLLARPRALRRIAAGEVVAMSYLSLQMLLSSAPARQELLRVQKGFVCGCERCRGADGVRELPCPRCSAGFCVPEPSSRETVPVDLSLQNGMLVEWRCRTCAAVVEPKELPLESEAKLLRFLLVYEPEDEQTIHSLIAVVNQDLGSAIRPATHFLCAWLHQALVKLLLLQAKRALRPPLIMTEQQQQQQQHEDGGRRAARSAIVLWRLLGWVRGRISSASSLLAAELAVPAIDALLAAGPRFAEQAALLATQQEPALAAALGPMHSDVRLLGRARSAHIVGDAAVPTTRWVAACEACGKRLLGPQLCETSVATATPCTPLSEAAWCSRCGLAAYCGPSCEAMDLAKHAPFCITAEGLPANSGSGGTDTLDTTAAVP